MATRMFRRRSTWLRGEVQGLTNGGFTCVVTPAEEEGDDQGDQGDQGDGRPGRPGRSGRPGR